MTTTLLIAEIIPYRLPLKRPWVGASVTLTERRGVLLRLVDEDGLAGWGDCAPLPSRRDPQAVIDALATWSCRPASAEFSKWLGARRDDFFSASAEFQHLPAEARWAIETALADLAAQRAGLPLWRHLGGTSNEVEVNAALGPLDEALPERLVAAQAQGYRIGKIKVGLAPVEEEIARLRALDTPLSLRLDANRAFDDDAAERFLTALADLPIEAVEEPFQRPSLAKLAALQARLPFPLALDESLPDFPLAAVIEARAVRRLVLKPARLGGIAATLAIAREAQAAGIEVVLTSVVDSAVGVTAATHLAAALSPDLTHGLGTSAWLAEDVAQPLPILGGSMKLPEAAGLGLTPATVRAGG